MRVHARADGEKVREGMEARAIRSMGDLRSLNVPSGSPEKYDSRIIFASTLDRAGPDKVSDSLRPWET